MQDDLFIKSLARDLKPKVSIVSSQRPLLGWLVFSLFAMGIAVSLHSLRPDASQMLDSGSYYFELFSALSVGIIAAGSALTLRIPGSKAPLKVLGAAVAIWIASLALHSFAMNADAWRFNLQSESVCMASIMLFGALPALVLYHLVRRGATTEPQKALALIAMAFTSLAAAFLALACSNDGLVHLLIGHALPLFVTAALGWWAGRKLLSW